MAERSFSRGRIALGAAIGAVVAFLSGLVIPDPWPGTARRLFAQALALTALGLGAGALGLGAWEWRRSAAARAATWIIGVAVVLGCLVLAVVLTADWQ
jgi:hypothetical protein